MKKKLAREEARQARQQLFDKASLEAPEQLSTHLATALAKTPVGEVAGYLPVNSEMDTRFAQADLARRGWAVGLPCVEVEDAPLEFRLWEMGDPLIEGPYGIEMPSPEAELLSPTVVLVPMLAFDVEGHRLGYGGGYYDRSIEKLRKSHSVLTVGLAFAGQLVKSVPRDDHDQVLDMIVTERGIWLPGVSKSGAAGFKDTL